MTRAEWESEILKIYLPVEKLSAKEGKTVLHLRHRTLKKDLVMRGLNEKAPAYGFLKSHPIVGFPRVYDMIACEDGCVVLEEWIEGESVDQKLEIALFSYRGASKILRQAALSLALLHEKGFVHRDIKPGNLILTETGKVYLADLETGRLVKNGPDTRRLGTAGFAAPEQYLGRSDCRSDIYALGVTLGVMLTGRHPSEKMPDAGKARRIIRKATETDPTKRYQSALDFADAL